MRKEFQTLAFFLVAALCLVAVSADEVEDHVLTVTDANIEQVLADNKNIVIEFYAPWCGHCKRLLPEFAKAASTLKTQNSSVKLAKINCDNEKQACGKYEIRGYPTIKYFANGAEQPYKGGRSEQTILNWIKTSIT